MATSESPMEVRSLAKLSNAFAAKRLLVPQPPLILLRKKERQCVPPRLPPLTFKVPLLHRSKLSQSLSVSGLSVDPQTAAIQPDTKVVRLYTKRVSLGCQVVMDRCPSRLSEESAKEPLALSFSQIHRDTPKLSLPKFMFREYDKALRERLDVYLYTRVRKCKN